MERLAYFFDGFSIYHSLKYNSRYHKFMWLDYYKLAQIFTKKTQTIVSVTYFTAYSKWKLESYKRHQIYVSALRHTGVEPVFGNFKNKTIKCKICGGVSHKYHEEKETDVNIALAVLKGALLNEFDTAIISTSDSDFIPVIRYLRNLSISKRVGILIPIGSSGKTRELQIESDFYYKIKEKHLATCQLPDEIKIGTDTIARPDEWK